MLGIEREPYPSDLADGQWALIEPVITAWKQDRVARSANGDLGACDLREVVNAIFYQNRTGCQWRYLPHDLPAWSAVFYYFGLRREDGLDQRIQELLRCQVRERARRLEDPSLVIIDTQSVRAAAGVPKTTTGLDANKKVSGRKRGLAVDVPGLIIGVVVLAVSVHDNAAGTALLDQAAMRCGMRLEKALVDQGFKDEVLIHGALLDIDVEVVRRTPDDQGKGFVPQPKRWIVEQVNGTLMLHRRLAREYDHRPDTSASRVYWAPSRKWPAASPHPPPPGATPSGRPREHHRAPGRPPGPARQDHGLGR
ncbi:IS5 family transposase [Streptomyces decoyicus]